MFGMEIGEGEENRKLRIEDHFCKAKMVEVGGIEPCARVKSRKGFNVEHVRWVRSFSVGARSTDGGSKTVV